MCNHTHDWIELMTWTEVKELAALIGAAIAILTFIKSTFEYVLQGAQKRAERFLAVRKVFKDNPKFRDICDYVDRDDPVLATLPLQDRRDFAGFLEEVAILTNSHIVSEEVSLHFFGYYAKLSAGSSCRNAAR